MTPEAAAMLRRQYIAAKRREYEAMPDTVLMGDGKGRCEVEPTCKAELLLQLDEFERTLESPSCETCKHGTMFGRNAVSCGLLQAFISATLNGRPFWCAGYEPTANSGAYLSNDDTAPVVDVTFTDVYQWPPKTDE